MGRGDKKTKKGKIFRGSYGKARSKKNENVSNAHRDIPKKEEEEKTEE